MIANMSVEDSNVDEVEPLLASSKDRPRMTTFSGILPTDSQMDKLSDEMDSDEEKEMLFRSVIKSEFDKHLDDSPTARNDTKYSIRSNICGY